ncbi:MAG TPA: hypothetical protein VF189_00370 [Patescibacteria group bacterium]
MSFSFSTSKRPEQFRLGEGGKVIESAGPKVTAHGAFVETPEGKRLAVMGDGKDPFAVHEENKGDKDPHPTPRTIQDVEDKVDQTHYDRARRTKAS